MSKDSILLGFVGLGTMGGKMAANLQKAGYKLVVHDIHSQAASHHLKAGAIWSDSPRALAMQSDVMFTSLPEPHDVEAVALGPEGLLAGIKPGAAYFDLSTNSPLLVRRLADAFAAKNAHMLDAPVSGGPAGAHLLAEAGARHIALDYDPNGKIVGMHFVLMVGSLACPFALPVRIEAVQKIFKDRRVKTQRWDAHKYEERDREQAERVAWRQLLMWVKSQLAMVGCGARSVKEITSASIIDTGRRG